MTRTPAATPVIPAAPGRSSRARTSPTTTRTRPSTLRCVVSLTFSLEESLPLPLQRTAQHCHIVYMPDVKNLHAVAMHSYCALRSGRNTAFLPAVPVGDQHSRLALKGGTDCSGGACMAGQLADQRPRLHGELDQLPHCRRSQHWQAHDPGRSMFCLLAYMLNRVALWHITEHAESLCGHHLMHSW